MKILYVAGLGGAALLAYRLITKSDAQKIMESDPAFAQIVADKNAARAAKEPPQPPLTDTQIVNLRARQIADELIAKTPALAAEVAKRNAKRAEKGQKPLGGMAVLKIAQDMVMDAGA